MDIGTSSSLITYWLKGQGAVRNNLTLKRTLIVATMGSRNIHMSTSTDTYVRARIDSASKVRAAEALGKMGLTIPDAIRLLLHRVVEDGRLPFDPVPNEVTRAAMLEVRHMKVPRFETVADLMAALHAEE